MSLLSKIKKEDNIKGVEAFVAGIVHDLKTPTMAQLNALELLESNKLGILNDKQKEIILQTKNSCKYMSDLILTLLDTYLFDEGAKKIIPTKFNIDEIIFEIMNEVQSLLDSKKQKFLYIKNEIEIFADKFLLKRVLLNIISNAIFYGAKDSIIEISTFEIENGVSVSVKNKNNSNVRKNFSGVFDKFKQNNHLSNTHFGLGLYLSKCIIEAHKGHIFAKSEDKYSIFGFFIPKKSTEIVNKLYL